MKIIKLTKESDYRALYLNTDYISYFSTYSAGKVSHTYIHPIGFNNGAFDVLETPEKIMELIQQAEETEELG